MAVQQVEKLSRRALIGLIDDFDSANPTNTVSGFLQEQNEYGKMYEGIRPVEFMTAEVDEFGIFLKKKINDNAIGIACKSIDFLKKKLGAI